MKKTPNLQTVSTGMLLAGLSLLVACATTPQPAPEDDMYALSALEAMGMLRDIKDKRTHPNHLPMICRFSRTNKVEVYLSDGFVIEEYWLTRRQNRLYLGIQHEYGRKLFEFSNGRIYTIVEPSYFAHSIDAETWGQFWLEQIAIHEVGDNRLTRKVAYDGGDELMENIGTTRIKIFLDPVYAFLDTYYAANEEMALQPVAMPLNTEADCTNPAVKGTLVGK